MVLHLRDFVNYHLDILAVGGRSAPHHVSYSLQHVSIPLPQLSTMLHALRVNISDVISVFQLVPDKDQLTRALLEAMSYRLTRGRLVSLSHERAFLSMVSGVLGPEFVSRAEEMLCDVEWSVFFSAVCEEQLQQFKIHVMCTNDTRWPRANLMSLGWRIPVELERSAAAIFTFHASEGFRVICEFTQRPVNCVVVRLKIYNTSLGQNMPQRENVNSCLTQAPLVDEEMPVDINMTFAQLLLWVKKNYGVKVFNVSIGTKSILQKHTPLTASLEKSGVLAGADLVLLGSSDTERLPRDAAHTIPFHKNKAAVLTPPAFIARIGSQHPGTNSRNGIGLAWDPTQGNVEGSKMVVW